MGLFWIMKGKIWPPAQITVDFTGKTVLVTGANTGIGFETALKYVQLKASKVVIGVRSLEKGEQAKAIIEQRTGMKDVIQVLELDMANYKSIEKFADNVSTQFNRLDAVVLNAGVIHKYYQTSPEGWENSLQINTISTALLAILLLPKLEKSGSPTAPTHLEIVSSSGNWDATLDKVDPKLGYIHSYNTEKDYSMTEQYYRSKLFMMFIMRELADRCSSNVIMNDTCPGGCRSDVFRDFNSLEKIVFSIMSVLLLRPAEQGARTLVGATLLGKESNGKFWVYDRFEAPSKYIINDTDHVLRKKIFDEVIDILKKDSPGIEGILAQIST